MKLRVMDRILLLNMWSGFEGKLTELRAVAELRSRVELLPTEQEHLKLVSVPGGVKWDEEKDEEVEIDVTPEMEDVIRKQLRLLSTQGRLPSEYLELAEQYIGADPPDAMPLPTPPLQQVQEALARQGAPK